MADLDRRPVDLDGGLLLGDVAHAGARHLLRLDNDLHPPVLRAPLRRLVRGDRPIGAVRERDDPIGGDPQTLVKVGCGGLGPAPGKLPVEARRTERVGVPLDHDPLVVQVLERRERLIEGLLRLLAQRGLPGHEGVAHQSQGDSPAAVHAQQAARGTAA